MPDTPNTDKPTSVDPKVLRAPIWTRVPQFARHILHVVDTLCDRVAELEAQLEAQTVPEEPGKKLPDFSGAPPVFDGPGGSVTFPYEAPDKDKLPEDIPHRDLLEAAGVTREDLPTLDFTEVEGIGPRRAEKIQKYLKIMT